MLELATVDTDATPKRRRTKRPDSVHMRISPEEREVLERIAAEDDRSISSVLRMALRDLLERRGVQ